MSRYTCRLCKMNPAQPRSRVCAPCAIARQQRSLNEIRREQERLCNRERSKLHRELDRLVAEQEAALAAFETRRAALVQQLDQLPA